MTDILDAAVESIVHDGYNHIPADVLRERLARIRRTHLETRLHEDADALIERVRYALTEPGDPEYGDGLAEPQDDDDDPPDDGKVLIAGVLYDAETLQEADPQ